MGKEGENIGGVGLVQKSGVDKEKISKKGSRKRGLQKSVGSVKEKFGKDVLLSIMDDVVETELNVERMKLKRDEDRKGFQDSIEQKRNARREAKKARHEKAVKEFGKIPKSNVTESTKKKSSVVEPEKSKKNSKRVSFSTQ